MKTVRASVRLQQLWDHSKSVPICIISKSLIETVLLYVGLMGNQGWP